MRHRVSGIGTAYQGGEGTWDYTPQYLLALSHQSPYPLWWSRPEREVMPVVHKFLSVLLHSHHLPSYILDYPSR